MMEVDLGIPGSEAAELIGRGAFGSDLKALALLLDIGTSVGRVG
ncbi:hypothetical protein ACFQ0K_13500 [Nocardioides caeni]|nr:hypothetical protein [Nocardioides caeni]